MDFRIGCALWAYKAWVGELFPPGSQATDFLSLYSHRFTTVEGNTTFYSVPDRKTVQRWASVTPAGFEFCLKLPKAITHDHLLQPKLAATMQFLEQMQDLGDRRGPFFAQLPPSYSPAYFDDLAAFLTALPRQESEFALEVRHPEWFQLPHCDRLTDLLTELGIGRVLLDSRPVYEVSDDPQVHSERRKPKLPLQMSLTAPFSLIRFISHPEQQTNWTFLQDWLTQVEHWLQQGIRLYFFVHCPVEERSPSNARYIQHCLEQQGTAIPQLPWDAISPEATQLQLF
ncbi:DUF72 domain-containing protein [Pantanalinema sp. GBBB05]|uniref:DUF72 domain-containing protein n=1 Tax=Pantanalinema sp. GBBB05 TaxID=2604139 RepID=UPI001D4F34E0|nr:DUF72 domain-containing protein [Pantanalinema sp. GBBB05]